MCWSESFSASLFCVCEGIVNTRLPTTVFEHIVKIPNPERKTLVRHYYVTFDGYSGRGMEESTCEVKLIKLFSISGLV